MLDKIKLVMAWGPTAMALGKEFGQLLEVLKDWVGKKVSLPFDPKDGLSETAIQKEFRDFEQALLKAARKNFHEFVTEAEAAAFDAKVMVAFPLILEAFKFGFPFFGNLRKAWGPTVDALQAAGPLFKK